MHWAGPAPREGYSPRFARVSLHPRGRHVEPPGDLLGEGI